MTRLPLSKLSDAASSRIGSALLSLAFGAGSLCYAQTAQPLVPNTIVTGQCQSHGGEPGCVLPNLFGDKGLTVFASQNFPHYAHFIGSAQTTLNQTLSTAIATQLTALPIISPSSGFTYRYDSEAGAFVRTTTSFGPIYSERAETIGRGRVSFGVSYQRFRFSSIDGIDLHKVPAVFSHIPDTGPNDSPETYEADVIKTTNNINLNMDSTVAYATVGITDRIDASASIPLVSVRMGVNSDATIIRVSGPTVTIPGVGTVSNPHQFTADPNSLTNSFYSHGDASGIGDVSFRVKGNVWRGSHAGLSLGLDVRTPTGNAWKFLGSGAAGIKPFMALSATRKHFSPHLNLGYQWNGSSILAGNLTGTSVFENAAGIEVIQDGRAVKGSLPSQLSYALGGDFGAAKGLTLSFDYLGQTLINAPRVFRENTKTADIPGGTGALILPTINGGKDTTALSSGAVGFKYNLFGNLLLTGNVLFRLDNKGLRENVVPLAALSYAFGGK